MRQQSLSKLQQCPEVLSRLGPAGSWVQPAGRVVTLDIPDASALAITQGRVWATFDGPHQGPANDLGNVILAAGERLSLHSGQRVVIESCSPNGTPCSRQNAYFSLWSMLPPTTSLVSSLPDRDN